MEGRFSHGWGAHAEELIEVRQTPGHVETQAVEPPTSVGNLESYLDQKSHQGARRDAVMEVQKEEWEG